MTFTTNFLQEKQPEMEREAKRRLRDLVVLVPSPFQGHVTPMLQLGHVLHSKGFSITVAHARCNVPDPSNHPEFSFQGLGHSLSINLDGIIKASDIGLKGRLETIYDMNENCRVPLQEYLEEKGDVVSCIIYDNLMFFVDQVAVLLNLPSIVLRPSSAAYFPVLLHVLKHKHTLSSIPGLEEKERLIEDFEKRTRKRGRVVKWAPQKKVLAHGSVGGFWSHCGWNSTLESLGEGVPMICRPHFADQLVNSRLLIQEWKVGLELEKVERGVIAETIRRLMVGDERKELKKNAMDMKQKLDDSFQKEEGTSNKAVNELTNFISSISFKFPL
ncbi:unnamed protein product [Cuscuta europaea]|uniref:Uncharacterized protein n=1 Tax=Cuscuta europaea TaxID=41803 RepID=A0A9P1EPG1_CUSEU|nr:unnamed protein product [Cuscuta europaea]